MLGQEFCTAFSPFNMRLALSQDAFTLPQTCYVFSCSTVSFSFSRKSGMADVTRFQLGMRGE
jgi:hypothetical protein